MTSVNMGTHRSRLLVHRIYRGIQGIQYYWGKHGYTRYIEVYRVHSITRVNMGTQDI